MGKSTDREYRQLLAFKHSVDHGQKWRTVVICTACRDKTDPPAMLKPMGEASSRSCEWCGCGHTDNKPPEPTQAESEFVSSFTNALAGWAKEQGIKAFEPEDLPPNEVCDLDIAFSPIIPTPHGTFDSAVEVEKLNDSLYRYEWFGELRTVTAEELKTMRIRYIVAHGKLQSAYMVALNPEDHMFHKLGKQVLGDESAADIIMAERGDQLLRGNR